jgi:hypothetical protein
MATRSLGRPKNRWENDGKNDLNTMRIRSWKDCIQDQHKGKESLRRPKHSMIEVVEPKEEE